MTFREEQRLQAYIDRLGYYDPDKTKCDLCHQVIPLEYHERIPRSRTIGNPEARELSFDRRLCNLLCKSCHNLADNKDIALVLWRIAVKLYTIEDIQEAFDKLNQKVRAKLILPEVLSSNTL